MTQKKKYWDQPFNEALLHYCSRIEVEGLREKIYENKNNKTITKKKNICILFIWNNNNSSKQQEKKTSNRQEGTGSWNVQWIKPYKYFISSSRYIHSDSFIFFYIPINFAFVPFMVDFPWCIGNISGDGSDNANVVVASEWMSKRKRTLHMIFHQLHTYLWLFLFFSFFFFKIYGREMKRISYNKQ